MRAAAHLPKFLVRFLLVGRLQRARLRFVTLRSDGRRRLTQRSRNLRTPSPPPRTSPAAEDIEGSRTRGCLWALRRQVPTGRCRGFVRSRRRGRNPRARSVHRPRSRPAIHAQLGSRRPQRGPHVQPHALTARDRRRPRRPDRIHVARGCSSCSASISERAMGLRRLRERARQRGRRLEARVPARLSNVLYELRGWLGEALVRHLRAVRAAAAGPSAIGQVLAVSVAFVPPFHYAIRSRAGRPLRGPDLAGSRSAGSVHEQRRRRLSARPV